MHRRRVRLVFVAVVAALVVAFGPAGAAGRQRERPSQVQYTFVNATGGTVYGLVVRLSHPAAVATDDEYRAGPFRNINGNDTTKVRLSNPAEPIGSGGEADLTFRGFRELKVKRYWWTDARGKRVGPKIEA